MASLSKAQREELYKRYSGRCAYCGDKLGKRWNADHVKPVGRISRYEPPNWRAGVPGRFVHTGKLEYPERDCFENLMPACSPCNIDKSTFSLDEWRCKLERSAEVLERNYSAYRHAKRFGLVVEALPKVVFFFERPRRRIINP